MLTSRLGAMDFCFFNTRETAIEAELCFDVLTKVSIRAISLYLVELGVEWNVES